MELQNQNGAATLNGAAKTTTTLPAKNDGLAKANGVQPKKQEAKSKPEAEKPAPVQTEDNKPETVKPEIKADEIKADVPQQAMEVQPKPVLNLVDTLKAVDVLHRKSIQRVNLITRIRQLEAFEVTLTKENDELEDNPYQGCKLIIEDDKQRQFVTTTPGLIRLVSQFIFNACNEKLTEIEASIVFPNV